MTGLGNLIRRNIRLFFKDKGMFFSSLITPIILLVLYITFLANVYRDSFASAVPQGITIDDKLLNGIVAGQLVSSLLAVSCVTVAFCSNLLMINDKVNGAIPYSPLCTGSRLLYFFGDINADNQLFRPRRRSDLHLYTGLVHVTRRCIIFDSRRFSADLVRHRIVIMRQLFAHNQRSGIGGRNNRQRRIRISLRCIHANVAVRKRTPKSSVVPPRHIRNKSYPQPRNGGNFP